MTEPMKVETLERLMSNFKPTPELDEIFGRGLTSDTLTIQEMEKLEAAGYVLTDDKGENNITEPARKYAWANLPEQSKVFKAKVDMLEAKRQKKKEKERAKQSRQRDAETAQVFIKQGLLVVHDNRYHNTPAGWKEALWELRYNLQRAFEDRDSYYREDTELESSCGDFENVPVSQPWQHRDNVLVIKRGFKSIKKRILESLSDEELELFGQPPRANRLNRPAATAKAKLVEALTRCQEGAASDLVIAKSKRR